MEQTLEHVAAAALQLSIAERAELASRLLASLEEGGEPGHTHEGWEAAWTAECDRREAELDVDPSLAISAEDAFRRARASLDARLQRRSETA